jgi:hypothetical protein
MLATGPFGCDYFVAALCDRPDATSVAAVTMQSQAIAYDYEPTHVKLDIEGYELEDVPAASRS